MEKKNYTITIERTMSPDLHKRVNERFHLSMGGRSTGKIYAIQSACEHEFVACNEYGEIPTTGNNSDVKTMNAICHKCGYKPIQK